jgi:hypothetical protein
MIQLANLNQAIQESPWIVDYEHHRANEHFIAKNLATLENGFGANKKEEENSKKGKGHPPRLQGKAIHNIVFLLDMLESLRVKDFAKKPHEAEAWIQDETLCASDQRKSFLVILIFSFVFAFTVSLIFPIQFL